MTPTVELLTTGEQAQQYAHLLLSALPVLSRHHLDKPVQRTLDHLARGETPDYSSLLDLAARIRRHGELLSGVRIGWHVHRWSSPLGAPVVERESPDGAVMRALSVDLTRVLRGALPLR